MAHALTRQADCRLDQSRNRRRFARRCAAHCCNPADPEYEDARTIWNAMIARRPALIARVSGSRGRHRLRELRA